MIDRKLLARMLDIESFNAKWQYIDDEEGNTLEEYEIQTYWSAEIEYFRPKSIQNLTAAVVHTQEWTRGVLLMTPIREPLDREFSGKQPLKYLNMTHWDDPVVSLLTDVNLLPFSQPLGTPMFLYQRPNAYFHLYLGTRDSESNIFYTNRVNDPRPINHMDYIFQELIKTVWYMIEQYDDDEMRQFVTEELDYPRESLDMVFETPEQRASRENSDTKKWWGIQHISGEENRNEKE